MSPSSFSITAAPAPPVAVEIASHRVAAVSLEVRGGRPVVAAHASEPLPDGAVVPSLTGENIRQRGAVAAAVARILEATGRPRRVGLVVPDPVAKVSLVRFEQVPAKTSDLDQLIRWQVRKTAPFPIEEAQVSYVPAARTDEGQEFLVSLARRAAVEEYESICSAAGAQAGLVDLSTFNVANAVLAGAGAPAGDWLLVNVASDWASLAIMRGTQPIFFRSRGADGDGSLADIVHQTAMYYEDRIRGAGFVRVLLCGASSVGSEHAGDVELLRRGLQERLGSAVEVVDPTLAAPLTDRIAVAPGLLDALAPLVGLLLRDRESAA